MKNKILIGTILTVLLACSIAASIDLVSAGTIRNNIRERVSNSSWIRINGDITQWGDVEVRGQLQSIARQAKLKNNDDKQLTSATAIWTTNITRAISAARSKENFTYYYYTARLPNASIETANVDSASNYFLSGTWKLSNITSTITVYTDEYGNITRVHRDQDIVPFQAYGELTVTGNTFTLTITGLDTLTGSIRHSMARSWFNPFKMTDDATSDAVTGHDVKAIAQCYGAMPGWGNYNTNMDFNNNYRVDIADISTVASNT
ncbi:MAG: hypothetical protein NWE92_13510 [Candidatus Bathyarchaeota archaeon]|nr:hypothetical protein [Candidatus Bathyarchaeota archaeon]